MRNSYVKNIILGELNMISVRNKFFSVKELLSDNLDLLKFHLYINEDIRSKQIHSKLLEGLESTCIEMNLRKPKWLVIGIYKLPQSCGKLFTEKLKIIQST